MHCSPAFCINSPATLTHRTNGDCDVWGREYRQSKGHMTPIGKLIQEELLAQERSVSWFARKLHLDRSNVYRLFQKNSIDTDLLSRISIILGRNFFEPLSDNIKERNRTPEQWMHVTAFASQDAGTSCEKTISPWWCDICNICVAYVASLFISL